MKPQHTPTNGDPIPGPAFAPGCNHRRADLHLHSNFSGDVPNLPELSPRALYEKAIVRGMDYFTLTDHDTMDGVLTLERELEEEFDGRPPIPIIPGIEMKVRDPEIGHTVHINVLGLAREQMGELMTLRHSMTAFLACCRQHDLYHSYNHPFWFERGERPRLRTIAELVRRFPVIELNAGRIPQLNHRTVQMAQKFDRQLVAASDSHTGQVGKAFTEAPGETPGDFLRNIRAGACRAVPHHMAYREFMEEITEAIDLVFANQTAFHLKDSFLQQNPIARRIARGLLGSQLLMRPGRLKRGVRIAMRLMAYGPAHFFILQQRRMHEQLGEVTLLPADAATSVDAA